ncbi:MAG: DUF3500 domain-containing protein [Acidobacteria bacterium]|nr:DUF3500 domain-containing protein [Acidobacteriota bacterium]
MKKWITLLILTSAVAGAWAGNSSRVAMEMANRAQKFLAALSSEQQNAAVYPFGDEERLNWHFIPRQRKGVPLKTMSEEQRELAHMLLASALSPRGHDKVKEIMSLEEVLFHLENQDPRRDSEAYFFTIFGPPSLTEEWGWRMEGHHISLNFTLRDGQVVSTTPAFFGANPARVKEGPRQGLRVLASEELLARKLLHMFVGSKQEKALIQAEAPADIVTGASRQAEMGNPVGVPRSEMTPEQLKVLQALVKLYQDRFHPELAKSGLDDVAGSRDIYFAWAGGVEPGQPHYYRIQGDGFVIEYDNTQNNANHIHTVWRDFKGDFGRGGSEKSAFFGRDPLREHYVRHHRSGSGHGEDLQGGE